MKELRIKIKYSAKESCVLDLSVFIEAGENSEKHELDYLSRLGLSRQFKGDFDLPWLFELENKKVIISGYYEKGLEGELGTLSGDLMEMVIMEHPKELLKWEIVTNFNDGG